ncbi:MAG TPA: PAS domain S-box protein [Desulfurivibrio alkaliphilus]|uniref:histidine kinase n=1 Tax=Desulfurivibrio alkaliphilus TaxID=427923 RepID=A0A7C2TJW5_9BACT|nr:PAS domain S-box protein [Desulfurivibrio alkaliphilus]
MRIISCDLFKLLWVDGSIRTKVRACMLIALVGYFIATVSSFYSNSQQAARLASLQTIHFPLARLSEETLNIFRTQLSKYEDAFLTGEAEQVLQANKLSSQIMLLLMEMEEVAAGDPSFFFENALIDDLGERYEQFYRLAAEVYLDTQSIETSLEMQKTIQFLGNLQTGLLQDLIKLNQHLGQNVEQIIQKERQYAQLNTIFLGLLFLLVLLSATFISRCFANRQLIQPLGRIQQMVVDFARTRKISPPPPGSENDEINQLATSFWEMTQELEQTMVSRDYVDNIIKHMSSCLMVLSAELTLSKINDNTRELLGYGEEELLGEEISRFISADTAELFQSRGVERLARGQDVSNLEIGLLTKERREITVLFSASVMRNAEGQIDAVICVANNITERKKTEEVLRKIEIERALAKTAALAAIGELTSSIAHEMRNPLSSIKMNAKMIQRMVEGRDATVAELAEISSQQSLRLEKMLNDLLSYGKPLTLQISRTTTSALLNGALTAVRQEIVAKEVNIEVVDQTDQRSLLLDLELMTQALSNLILNAVQWSPAGETVKITARFIEEEYASRLLFEIRDKGPGINPEKIRRLFQPFFTTRQGGTGLGLATVRKIVEYHGGTVSAENLPEGGALFQLTIPPQMPAGPGDDQQIT